MSEVSADQAAPQPHVVRISDPSLEYLELSPETYNTKALGALALVGMGCLAIGQYHANMPDFMHFDIAGFMPLGSARHVLPATAATVAGEWYCDTSAGYAPRPLRWSRLGNAVFDVFFKLAMKNEKVTAFAAGFLPSLAWEVHQYSGGGVFGVADLGVAAATGIVTLAVSTKHNPELTPGVV